MIHQNKETQDPKKILQFFFDMKLRDYFAFLAQYISSDYDRAHYMNLVRYSDADENYIFRWENKVMENPDITVGELLSIAEKMLDKDKCNNLSKYSQMCTIANRIIDKVIISPFLDCFESPNGRKAMSELLGKEVSYA